MESGIVYAENVIKADITFYKFSHRFRMNYCFGLGIYIDLLNNFSLAIF